MLVFSKNNFTVGIYLMTLSSEMPIYMLRKQQGEGGAGAGAATP